MRKLLGFAAAVMLAGSSLAADLAVGQVWSLKGETTMRAVVGRIEDIGGHDVVHISLTGVLIPDGKGTLTNIPHMPFDRLAFEASIDTIVVENASADPQFEQGYEIWSSDRGGVFTISVPEAAHLAINMMMER